MKPRRFPARTGFPLCGETLMETKEEKGDYHRRDVRIDWIGSKHACLTRVAPAASD